MKKIFKLISKLVGRVLRIIAWDLYDQRDASLKELEKISEDTTLAWTNKQTNDCLMLLNKNIIALNCSTSVYSRVLTILTFVALFLSIATTVKP